MIPILSTFQKFYISNIQLAVPCITNLITKLLYTRYQIFTNLKSQNYNRIIIYRIFKKFESKLTKRQNLLYIY